MSKHYLLAIDQGTTNSRAIIFNQNSQLISSHELSLTQSYPHPGWVEQNPQELLQNTILCCREAINKAQITPEAVAGIGISNQRETTIIWHKATGQPIYPAIVWQDRRTVDLCKQWANQPIAQQLPIKTGLLLDPYFSASKISWILDHVVNAREQAFHGELLFGTVDTYLLWHLTRGKVHATDITNASRTLLFNIKTQCWDDEILTALMIPKAILPQVFANTAEFGETDPALFGVPLRIVGMAGDQQAAAIGQACFSPGDTKVTYGTGGFLLMNTGDTLIHSQQGLLSTITYRIGEHMAYSLEGSFFSAGVSIKWLRDTLKIINNAQESEKLAQQLTDNGGVYLIPAFTGLGAPYWSPEARGALFGLTRASGREHFARAALESVAYQTQDLLIAMLNDYTVQQLVLNVDGGMAANHWLLQFIADVTGIMIKRPVCIESSALGVAYLAGLQVGMFTSLEDIAKRRRIDKTLTRQMAVEDSQRLHQAWRHELWLN